jgi:CysZ protein
MSKQKVVAQVNVLKRARCCLSLQKIGYKIIFMFLQDFLEGLKGYQSAWHFIGKHRLWHFTLWSGLLNLLLIGAGVYVAWWLAEALLEYAVLWFGTDVLEGSWLYKLGLVLALIPTVALFLKFYKYFAIIALSPLLSYIAEKVQDIETQSSNNFKWGLWLNNMGRGVYINFHNLIAELFWTAACFVLSLIPVLNIISPLLMLGIECYYTGFSLVDYRHEYFKLKAKESIAWTSRHKGLAVGNGLGWCLLMLVPVIGWLVAPVLSVVAAGLSANVIAKKELLVAE